MTKHWQAVRKSKEIKRLRLEKQGKETCYSVKFMKPKHTNRAITLTETQHGVYKSVKKIK